MSLTTVYSKSGEAKSTIHLPSVMKYAPIRPDVVHFVHSNLAKNRRQPYGRYNRAGHQHSAESWGTGRAVARVPRISGSGTSRNGQGAFANMTRGGRMFSPLKIWRRWHRLVNVSTKRYAMCSAIAASSVPALVMARGHKIDKVNEIPLVVADEIEEIMKTKEAAKLLKILHANDDMCRSADSRKIRAGVGKMRNRRYVQRRGVLLIHNQKVGISRAVRNIPGIDCRNVNRLNIRDLAPGGHIGRFIIWTEGAFKKLDQLYGTRTRNAQLKKGYRHPHAQMTTTDLNRIVNSPSIQKLLRPRGTLPRRRPVSRSQLLLTRKIRRHDINKSPAVQFRKARLEKLRKAGKLPAKKVKLAKPTKRVNHKNLDGVPLEPKAKREYLRKQKADRRKMLGERKKARLESIKKKIEEARTKRAALKAQPPKPKVKKEKKIKPRPLTRAQKKAKKATDKTTEKK
jgi:large subunit ribosomal protein L4e